MTKRVFLVLFVSLVARVFFSFFGTLELDFNTFVAWSMRLSSGGFINFYKSWSDYFPGYLYLLWILGKLKEFDFLPLTLLYKIPSILADLLIGFLIYKILKPLKGPRTALMGLLFYVFNPAILINSTFWGQVDSLVALFSLSSLYFLDKWSIFSALALAFGTAIKPQAAFIVPVIFFSMIKNKWKWGRIFYYGALSLGTFLLLFLPFLGGGLLWPFLVQRINVSFNQYPYTSVNAFNFWGIFGLWQKDNLFFQLIGFLVLLASFLVMVKSSLRKRGSGYILATVSFLVSFMFLTRMHERHLLPFFAPFLILAVESPILMLIYFSFSLLYVANLLYSYVWISENFRLLFSNLATSLLSTAAVFLTFLTLYFIKFPKLRFTLKSVSKGLVLPKIKNKTVFFKLAFILILVFVFLTRTINLWLPEHEYFDEVYHAFTARQMLVGDVKAWEWWNTPPAGFAYEWTHPPLAKEVMVLGMLIFGENSFAWRISGVFISLGVIVVIYFISLELFKDKLLAVMASAIFSLDGLFLVLSRIGMNDIYLLFFVLLAFYLFLKNCNFWSALTFGLALSSKWSALWFAPILLVAHFGLKKRFRFSYVWFLIVPVFVYLVTYLPFFLTGHTFEQFFNIETFVKCFGQKNCSYPFGLQQQMWWYHTALKAEHPYTSPWWSWTLMLRPVYLYTKNVSSQLVVNIYAMGNPAVFWFGLVSVFLTSLDAFIKRNKRLGLLVFAYLVFFVPWALSPRIMFLYHYLPALPFLSIATAYILRKNLRLILPFFLLAAVLFFYFYPHWIGLEVPRWLDESYYWFTSWR